MRIFVTGATGFVGSAVIPEFINAGHQVVGLARSEAGAKSLVAAGAQAHRGDLADLESLRKGAAMSDGVIHLAFVHDFSNYAASAETDIRAIEALGVALAGSERPFIVTSGIGLVATGRAATEDDSPNPDFPRKSEQTALAIASRGVRVSVVRLPQVHDTVKQGLITYAIAVARQKGVSAYVGDGSNRLPAAHILDTARIYRLALEKREAGAIYHAVAEQGVPFRRIAEAIGRGLKIPVISLSPEQAAAHFGWLAALLGRDVPASGALTQKRLGWQPTGPGLIADLEQMRYSDTDADTASVARRA